MNNRPADGLVDLATRACYAAFRRWKTQDPLEHLGRVYLRCRQRSERSSPGERLDKYAFRLARKLYCLDAQSRVPQSGKEINR